VEEGPLPSDCLGVAMRKHGYKAFERRQLVEAVIARTAQGVILKDNGEVVMVPEFSDGFAYYEVVGRPSDC
jgi:hypothetical protein